MAICYKPHCDVLSTTETRARVWDISLPGKQYEVLDDSELRAKVSALGSILTVDTRPLMLSSTAAGSSTSAALPMHIHRENRPLQVLPDTLQYLVRAVGFCDRLTDQVLHNWLPNQTYRLHFEGDDEKPTSLTLAFRLPQSSTNVMVFMRLQLSTRNCVTFLSGSIEGDVDDIRSRCIENARLLEIHPLYFLSFVYEYRYRKWTDWFAHMWSGVAEVETRTKLSHPNYHYTAPELDLHCGGSPAGFDTLLRKLHATDTELCHSGTVMKFALKFGKFCLDMLDEVEMRRQDLGFMPLPMRYRNDLEERLKSTIVRFESVTDRLCELKNRLTSQINVSYNLIAQRNSEINFAIAKLQFGDSQTVKGIAVLTLLFLPSTFIATLWTTNLVQLNADQNWVIYLVVTAVLTILVFLAWWVYNRLSRTRQEKHWPAPPVINGMSFPIV